MKFPGKLPLFSVAVYAIYRRFLERTSEDLKVWNEASNEVLDYATKYPNHLKDRTYPEYNLEVVEYCSKILAERILLNIDVE